MELLLSKDERDRFAVWLEHESAVSMGLAEQLDKLSGTLEMASKERGYAYAAALIARRLRDTESTSIG